MLLCGVACLFYLLFAIIVVAVGFVVVVVVGVAVAVFVVARCVFVVRCLYIGVWYCLLVKLGCCYNCCCG